MIERESSISSVDALLVLVSLNIHPQDRKLARSDIAFVSWSSTVRFGQCHFSTPGINRCL